MEGKKETRKLETFYMFKREFLLKLYKIFNWKEMLRTQQNRLIALRVATDWRAWRRCNIVKHNTHIYDANDCTARSSSGLTSWIVQKQIFTIIFGLLSSSVKYRDLLQHALLHFYIFHTISLPCAPRYIFKRK